MQTAPPEVPPPAECSARDTHPEKDTPRRTRVRTVSGRAVGTFSPASIRALARVQQLGPSRAVHFTGINNPVAARPAQNFPDDKRLGTRFFLYFCAPLCLAVFLPHRPQIDGDKATCFCLYKPLSFLLAIFFLPSLTGPFFGTDKVQAGPGQPGIAGQGPRCTKRSGVTLGQYVTRTVWHSAVQKPVTQFLI